VGVGGRCRDVGKSRWGRSRVLLVGVTGEGGVGMGEDELVWGGIAINGRRNRIWSSQYGGAVVSMGEELV